MELNHCAKCLLICSVIFTISHITTNAQRIKGSDTLLPITQILAETYTKLYPSSNITITGGGTGVGISSIIDGTTDIAMASRKIKFTEKMKLKKENKDVKEAIVAYDALAVIVNPKNPVSRLTRSQLEAIFRGKITNWKDVGGKNQRIVVYSRESSSGTYEFFKENVLENKNYMNSLLSMPATGAIIQSVKQTVGAIGYVGLAYVTPQVKALMLSYDNKPYYAPTLSNAIDKKYPLVRPLYFYYATKNERSVLPFINFINSKEGQQIILKAGFIPDNINSNENKAVN